MLSFLTFLAATVGIIAESNWNSPSILSSGLISFTIFIASLITSILSCSELPEVEKDNIAILGSQLSKDLTVSAEEIAIPAKSLASGCAVIAQSARANISP
ncbi:hypothetical protein D3C73_1502530 [compost metagenome]